MIYLEGYFQAFVLGNRLKGLVFLPFEVNGFEELSFVNLIKEEWTLL